MKSLRLAISTFLLLLILEFEALAHKEKVHQYIVREAYKVLRSQLGFDVPNMSERIGDAEEGTGPFIPGGLVVIGAFREDRDDVIWQYGTVHIRETASVTHLWEPDNGDGAKFETHWCINPFASYEYLNKLRAASKGSLMEKVYEKRLQKETLNEVR